MENAEEILQCLDEFAKVKPKDIPRELEEYLCFVAKTGDPVYQWPLIKCLFREKLISVITEFYETCPSVEIPPCPNVDTFNYDSMKSFILEKLDTFAAAPFTVQRICELLTTPRKEYNRIDKYMRALEKNILVVSTREPGNRRSTENGESIVNGLESNHLPQDIITTNIDVEVEMDDTSIWQKTETLVPYVVQEPPNLIIDETQQPVVEKAVQDTFISESKETDTEACSSTIDTVITSRPLGYMGYTPNITDLIIDPSTVTETPATPLETTVTPPENINVSPISSHEIADLETETPQDEEPPIYVGTTNKDTAFYVGTTENGDPVYRVKYEPYVEADYMALPEQELDIPEDTVYINPEVIKPEEPITETVTEPSPSEITQPETTEIATPEIESTETTQEPEESTQVPSSSEQIETSSWEVSDSIITETTISSSDEVPVNSSDATPTSAVTELSEIFTQEDQVTESNIESECTVSQTEPSAEDSIEAVTEDTIAPVVEPDESGVVEPTVESMEIEEEVLETAKATQEPTVSQTEETSSTVN